MVLDGVSPGKAPGRADSLAAAMARAPHWAILLAAALIARVTTFGNPVVHVDEEFYFVTAQRMLEGALPFVDVWDRKPIGLFLLYTPAATFGVPTGIWVYQAMALASVVATALLLTRLARHAGWGKGGLAAALLYIFMLNFADGQGGQAPVFYNLLTVSAVLVMLPRESDTRDDRRRIHRAMAAMLLIGIGLQIKYSVVFEGMFLGLWLLWREWKLGASGQHILRRGVAYAGMAWLPTLIVWTVYAALGHGDAWFYANFESIVDRQSDPAIVQLRGFLKVALILGPLLIVSGFSSRMPARHEHERRIRALLFGWLIAAVAGLLAFGGWFSHYALPVMVPASLCCAGLFAQGRRGPPFAALMVFLAFTGGQIVLAGARYHCGGAAQLEALAKAIGRGAGCMYLYSGDTILYSYTGRCTLTPWIFPSHLSRERENGAMGVDQIAEVRRIFSERPEIVVMRTPYRGERLAVRRVAFAEMVRLGYRLKGRWPLGNLPVSVYELPAASRTPPRRAASRPS